VRVGETHKVVRHVFKNNLGEVKRMPNFKNLDGAQKSNFSKFLFMKAWAFMHAAKKGDAFFIYALPTTMSGHNNMKSLLNTKTIMMCLKRRMLTFYQNINHMITQLIFFKTRNLIWTHLQFVTR